MIDWWTKNRSKISWHLPRYLVKILVKLIFLHIEYGSQSSMKRTGSGESGFVERSDPKWNVPETQPGYWSGATSHQCCGAGADFLRRLRLFNLYKDKYDPEHCYNLSFLHLKMTNFCVWSRSRSRPFLCGDGAGAGADPIGSQPESAPGP